MTVSFTCHTQIAMEPEELFNLARNVDAHVGSMASSRERAVAGVMSGLLSEGDEVTWQAWHFGLPLQMSSRITQFRFPDSFTDEQVRGPFRFFRHVHEFIPDGGGTLMIDRVEFAAPFGMVGRIAEKAFLGKYMRNLIDRRNEYLSRNGAAA
ncbi:SRPBCC family protein [Arthrobacter bambusae]|uniref:SRPBCC family protein n=1 Tax=Arthrobacter bambusae TaxID=1338426 RepID=UPI002784085E|nr:SRPBCC family protein [Arthrobacter bambusae]MDQ0030699.1 ligand-binding SRPBCC domain-containing protein [Arthrobacter bambusae]MDQ0099014.1 ligand-binding SRPBCC domain-containing protein [Arthrobacter bambusae]